MYVADERAPRPGTLCAISVSETRRSVRFGVDSASGHVGSSGLVRHRSRWATPRKVDIS